MSRNLPIVSGDKKPSQVSPLQLYLREIAKYPLLTPDEELEAAKLHHDEGDIGAAHRLVTANLRLVVKIANDFRQAQVSLLDLIQEGNYGLMQAVKKYNPYKGVRLSSYAVWWIRAYILKYIMDNKSQVKIGTTAAQRKLFFNLRKEADKLIAEYEHLDPKLLAERLDVREKDVIEMQMRLGAGDVSLDAPLDSEDSSNSSSRGSLLAEDREGADNLLEKEQLNSIFGEHINEFKKSLSGRDLEIFNLRLMSESPLTLQEIGDKYGISRERARQLESRILKSLKKFVSEKGIIDISND